MMTEPHPLYQAELPLDLSGVSPYDRVLAAIASINRELEIQPLLYQIVQQAADLVEATYTVVYLLDPNGKVAQAVVNSQSPQTDLEGALATDNSLVAHLGQNRQPFYRERYADLAISGPSYLADFSVIGLPIEAQGSLIGLLGLWTAPPRCFSETDLVLIRQLGPHLTIALTNAQRFTLEKHRSARVGTLNQINRLITTSLDLDQLLQTAVDAIAEHLHYPNVALLLIEPEDPTMLSLRASSGLYATPEIALYRQRIDQGIIGAAARSHRCLMINDVQTDPRYLPIPGNPGIRAELAVPVIVDDQLLGVLNIESTQLFTPGDKVDFMVIADQLGIAIDQGYRFAKTTHALDETQLLYQTSQRIGMALDVDAVIEAYLEQVGTRGRYACNIVLYEFDDAGRPAAVVLQGRWTPQNGLERVKERYPHQPDTLDPILDAGETITMSDVHSDSRAPAGLRRLQERSQRPALAMIPLMVRGKRIGLVVLSYATIHRWDEADLQPYQATAVQLATAIDSRRQRQLLYERGQQLAVLEERQRLARDLHDSVTQLIFSITLIAQSIAPAWERDPAQGQHRINRLLELSQQALVEMRALLTELRPPVPVSATTDHLPPLVSGVPAPVPGIVQVQQSGLAAALRAYMTGAVQTGLQVNFETQDYVPQALDLEKTLYHIAQEAFNNIVKHAQAKHVALRLSSNAQTVSLTVSDDGLGFAQATERAPKRSQKSGGFGLNTMRERAEARGGLLQINSRIGGGTEVVVTIPTKQRRKEK